MRALARPRGPARFVEDMGLRPAGTTLERDDGDADYAPGACRWATPTEQARNRSNVRLFDVDGERLPLTVLADRAGLARETVRERVYRFDWPVEDALAAPPLPAGRGGNRADERARRSR